MKTSITIFLSSMALLGVGVMIYDFQLDAVYRKGDYTRPFYDYITRNFHGFDRIDLNSSRAVNIFLVPGDFKVLASPDMSDFLDIRQEGTRLVINARFRDHFRATPHEYVLYVSCPSLKEFKANARYSIKDAVITDSVAHEPWYRPTTISGFNLDSLRISAENAVTLVLKNDTVRRMTAAMGWGTDLTLGEGDRFGGGDLEIMNGARLHVGYPGLGSLSYHLADGAELDINGAAAKQLLKNN